MKNNTSSELKPVYIHEGLYSADDEISLIDLAMVLVRRKKMIVITIIFFIALSVIFALLTPKSYTFSTSIEIGSQTVGGTIKSFESPQTLLAKMQHVFIPQVLSKQRQAAPDNKEKYSIKASIPKSSTLIVLETKGAEEKTDLMTKLLHNITQEAIHDHQRIYNAVKKNLLALKKQSNAELTTLNSAKNQSSEARRLLRSKIEVYETELANLRNTREILPPMKSVEPTGISRKLIVIIAAFAGIFLAIFSAFLAEFIAAVKEKGNQDT